MLIAYVGLERCDIAYYIGKISDALNEKTLLVDNSISGDLFRSLTDNSKDKVREYNNYTIVRNLKLTKNEIEAYENVILYHGLSNFDAPYNLKPDFLYVVVTVNRLVMYDTAVALRTSGFEETGARHTSLVLEDAVQKKLSMQTVAEGIGIIPSSGYVLPLDERNHQKYEMLVNNGSVSIKHVSSDMDELIKDAMSEIFLLEPKQAKKIAARL